MNNVTVELQNANVDRLRQDLGRYLEHEIELGSFPGAVWAIGDLSGNLIQEAYGNAVVKPARIPTEVTTRFDVASLTKPLITATLALIADEKEVAPLDVPISRWIPELREDKRDLTLTDLLTHRAGFQAWYPLYTAGFSTSDYLDALVHRPLRYKPRTSEIYSCLGYVLARIVLELAWKEPIESVIHREIFRPLHLPTAGFSPHPREKFEIAATEWGNFNERAMVDHRNIPFRDFRNYMIWGEVNDGNAWYLGGYGGNAGLFATAAEVVRLAFLYLTDEIFSPPVRAMALTNHTSGTEENRGIGWQLRMERPGHPSGALSRGCFGHTGFTGTSVWVDPERQIALTLLTNRLHPTVQKADLQPVRRRFHEIVIAALEHS